MKQNPSKDPDADSDKDTKEKEAYRQLANALAEERLREANLLKRFAVRCGITPNKGNV